MIPEKLTKPYSPNETEGRIYTAWEKSGFFRPEADRPRADNPTKKVFFMIMPPPNANGSLHVGHAVFVAIEDLMVRFKRMQGFKTLWLPGADHAGFETQVVYEKKLEKEGRSRFGMDPELLRKEILDFTLTNKSFMENQLRQLGASCDWSREKFTLDPDIIKIVYETFDKLSKDNLVYRGKRIVNWCTKHQTSLSDLETEDKEIEDTLYYITYGPFTVATVRPETIFGDVAIAVHPNDSRYKKYVGEKITITNPNGTLELPVIADESVAMDFGTGALKITPAHDPHDFEIAKKYNLSEIEVIDQYGKLNEKAGKYKGLSVKDARVRVADDLKEMGLLVKTESYKHNILICYKCERTLEPRILPQWFVKMDTLAKNALSEIEKGSITFTPESHKKIVTHWLSNICDWNISRQIVWGIPIPAKICDVCGDGVIDVEDVITSCPSCKGTIHKDTDTFDTWFSSGQWPYATLGYPEGDDFKTYYPTTVMETAGEIIFFWVARMIMLGLYRTGKAPFQHVYLHGLVTDKDGKKMSKSRGNVTDPIELATKYGTDALRMSLIVGNTPGTSTALYEDKIRAYKLFANKIWNASRFVLENTQNITETKPKLIEKDVTYLLELAQTTNEVTSDIEEYRFYLAGEKIYHYFWHTFADKIVEEIKMRIRDGSPEEISSAKWTLMEILATTLKLLHPFMPFITEELWSMLPNHTTMLMVEPWPKKHVE